MKEENKIFPGNRFDHLDLAKGIGIFLVVLGHASLRMDHQFYQDRLVLITQIIFSFVMPLFFMIAAALQRQSMEAKKISTSEYIYKRSKSILLPFFSLGIIFTILNICTPQSIVSTPSINEMIMGLLFYQSNDAIMPSGPLWFLFTLYLLSLIGIVFHKTNRANIIMLLGILLHFYSKNITNVHIFSVDMITLYFYFYFSGYVYHKTILNHEKINYEWSWPVLALIFYLSIQNKNITKEFFLLTGLSGTLLLILISNEITKYGNIYLKSLLSYIGKNSLVIYVFHVPSFVLTRQTTIRLHIIDNYFILICYVIIGIIVPLLIEKFMRISPLTYKCLLGRSPQ